jgi:hypothetical protein
MAELNTHPVFGELRWEQEYGWWSTQVRLSAAERLDVIVNPGDDDRFAFIESAAKLYCRAMRAERRILRDALREELLELYNDTWRRGEEPELTAKELMSRLKFSLIEIDTVVPITLNYEAAGLFGGHSVAVEVDEELQFQDIDLQG